jgi:hypothetical protein
MSTTRINVGCDGNGGTNSIHKVKETIVFGTAGNCTFTSFSFVDSNGKDWTPPGFSGPDPANGTGATVSYSYDGSPIPANGYKFRYTTTGKMQGDGSGVIKNK